MTVPVTLVFGWVDDIGRRVAAALAQDGDDSVLLQAGAMSPPVVADVETYTIDEEVAHRSPGCPCCAVRVDLVDTIVPLAGRRRPPQRIVVAATPGADPLAAVVTLLNDRELRSVAHLDATIACLDPTTAPGVATDRDSAWPSPALLDAVLLADHVCVRTTGHPAGRPSELTSWTAWALNPAARIHVGTADPIDLLDSAAWQPEGVAERLARLPRAPRATDPDDTLTGSLMIDVDGALDVDRLEAWLHDLHGTVGARVVRLEGVVALADVDRRQVIVGCRTAIRAHTGRPWGRERPTSRLRIVGRDLDHRRLTAGLRECAA
jgi:G3E family GTPase